MQLDGCKVYIPIKEIKKLMSPASTNAVVSSELKMTADLDRVSV